MGVQLVFKLRKRKSMDKRVQAETAVIRKISTWSKDNKDGNKMVLWYHSSTNKCCLIIALDVLFKQKISAVQRNKYNSNNFGQFG